MRKIQDDNELLTLSETMTGRELAKHYGVSEPAISKRLKKLRQQIPPESLSRLTEKQQRFAVALASGATQTQAAMDSHDVADRNSAKSLGHKLAQDPDINTAVTDLLAQVGIPKRRRAERLADMIESPDLSIVGRGLELSYKLDQSFIERAEIYHSVEDIRKLIALVGTPIKEPIDITPDRPPVD